MSILNISWEDLWAYCQCPRKLAADTRHASLFYYYWYGPRSTNAESDDVLNALSVGSSGRVTVDSIDPASRALAENTIAPAIASVSRERLQEYAKHVVKQSVKPTERVLEALSRKYGDIHTIGNVTARQPDMVCRPHPDFYVLTSSGKRIIVEMKSRPSEKQKFKAEFYNGLTDSHGVFVVEERWENGLAVLVPRVVREPVEMLLVYPDSEEVVGEKFPVNIELVKNAALAKQLGYRGKCPVDSCGPNCKHNRLNLKLAKTYTEPLRPLGLAFCELLQQESFNFDYHYQIFYKWRLGDWVREFFQDELPEPAQWNEWLKEAACLNPRVVDDIWKGPYEVGAETLLKKTGREGNLWRRVLHVTVNARDAQSVLGNGRGVFALPEGSELFLEGAIDRWAS
jgi:hypothetical protein